MHERHPYVHVFTLFNEPYAPLAQVTLPRIQEWCAYWGYTLTVGNGKLRPEYNPSWNKLALMHMGLAEHEVGIWVDIDVVILNPRDDLSSWFPSHGIRFSTDSNGLCAGFFMTHGRWARDFLNSCLTLGDLETNTGRWEQDTIKHLSTQFPNVRRHINLLPDMIVQNPGSTFNPEAFAMHLWAGRWTMDAAVAAAQELGSNWTKDARDAIYRRRWPPAPPESKPHNSAESPASNPTSAPD